MYESQFQLKRRPFAATPDARCCWASGPIQAALDELVVCVEQGQGVAIASAPAGTGKTLLCERLRMELQERFEVVVLRHASFLTRRALLQTILADLNHSYRRHDEHELRLELIPAIRALSPRREALVLICDEAHMLSEELLEELRMLSDLSEHGRPQVRLVLVGQPGLEETLARPGLEALNQRVRAHACLDSFDRTAALDYIDYRITWAGGRTAEIFTPEALELIVRASEGVPRCINQLCDHALLLAYVAELQPVPAVTIRGALQDLRQLPLHWNESLLGDIPATAQTSDDFHADELDADGSHNLSEISNSPEPVRMIESNRAAPVLSFEFGADLPEVESVVMTLGDAGRDNRQRLIDETCESIGNDRIGDQSPAHGPASSAADSNAADSDDIDEVDDDDAGGAEFADDDRWSDKTVAESTSDATFNQRTFSIAHSPQIVVQQPASVWETAGNSNITHPREVVEELVCDRYAAIDGGFPMPTPTPLRVAVESLPAASQHDTSVTHQVRPGELNCEHTVSGTSDSEETTVGDARLQESVCEPGETDLPAEVDVIPESVGEEFAAVCTRLEELLSKVQNNPAWDSATLEFGVDVGSAVVTVESTEPDDWDSIEAELGVAVCDIANALRAEFPAIRDRSSAVEQLHELLVSTGIQNTASIVSASIPTESIEIGAETTGNDAPHDGTSRDVRRAATESAPARPFRNLFSQLRRKQQGLL